jgi:hypothetical protein
MEFNSYVFPIPTVSYSSDDFKGELIWIPKKEHFNYRDKIKYNNYKSLIPKNNNLDLLEVNGEDFGIFQDNDYIKKVSISGKIGHRRYTSLCNISSHSFIQKIPSVSFSFDNKFQSGIETKKIYYIPCLFLKVPETGSNKIIIYFHANYEDLGSTYQICSAMCKNLKMNVLSVEYPNYGIYKSETECSSDIILKDADIIYHFLTEIMNIKDKDIILLGRCIGSGPASYLATKFVPASLILISPFKSIKAAVKSMFDKMKFGWFFEKLVKER